MIEGILVTPLKRVEHPKGDIYHAMKASSPGYCGFGEAYFSTVGKGIIKGWKRHRRLILNLVVPVGAVRFVIQDDRESSSTRGKFSELVVGAENYVRLTVPAGLWVGFQGLHDSNMLLNIIAEEHDPEEADNMDIKRIDYAWNVTNESFTPSAER